LYCPSSPRTRDDRRIALPDRQATRCGHPQEEIGCLELLDLYLKRVETFNPALNAIIATDIDGARKRAKAADRAVKAGKKLGRCTACR